MPGIFNASIFNNDVFNTGGTAPPAVVMDGGRWPIPKRPRQRDPEDIAREQRMVQDYLDELDRKKRESEKKAKARVPARAAKKAQEPRQADAPVLSEAVARLASEMQLKRITEHAKAEKRAREIARAELERRHWVMVLALAIED